MAKNKFWLKIALLIMSLLVLYCVCYDKYGDYVNNGASECHNHLYWSHSSIFNAQFYATVENINECEENMECYVVKAIEYKKNHYPQKKDCFKCPVHNVPFLINPNFKVWDLAYDTDNEEYEKYHNSFVIFCPEPHRVIGYLFGIDGKVYMGFTAEGKIKFYPKKDITFSRDGKPFMEFTAEDKAMHLKEFNRDGWLYVGQDGKVHRYKE